MVDSEKVTVGMYYRGIPRIMFQNVEVKMCITHLFEINRDIYEYLGLLLLRLDYEPEDNILVYNYNKEDNSFMCSVNNMNERKIIIDKEKKEIVVIEHNYGYVYDCVPEERSELGIIISLGRYCIKYADGVIFTRYLSRDNAKFEVVVCDIKLELELDKPIDVKLRLFNENGKYAKYKLDKEEDVIEYLSKEAINKNLIDIYKDLSEIYLDDVSKYPNLLLKLSSMGEEEKVTDLIHLRNGKFEKFGITDYGMTIFVDKDDNWSYEIPKDESLPLNFSISSQKGKVNCMFSFDEEEYDIYKYMDSVINSDIDIAMDEVVKTRRMVKELFDKNKGSN